MARPKHPQSSFETVRSPRFAVPAKATLLQADGEKRVEGRISDLSCHGALVMVGAVFPVGTRVVLEFEIVVQNAKRVLSVPGVITRLSHKGAALDFIDVPGDTARLLLDYTMQRLFGAR